MFTHIKTSAANKVLVTELTRRLSLGPENVIARLAFAYSIAQNKRLELSKIQDSKGKEYNKSVLFGSNLPHYVALVSTQYGLYKTDKDIPRYIKMHVDHGLELLDKEIRENPNLTGFEFIIQKIENGLKYLE